MASSCQGNAVSIELILLSGFSQMFVDLLMAFSFISFVGVALISLLLQFFSCYRHRIDVVGCCFSHRFRKEKGKYEENLRTLLNL